MFHKQLKGQLNLTFPKPKQMKRLLTYIFVIGGLTTATNAHAQAKEEPSEEKGKQGFTLGVLPALAYDADLGFQYGLLTNLYWYGDGSRYPKYNHSLYLEASRFKAGTTLLRAYYDSPELIPNYRTTVDLTWFNDLTMDFYGFNGHQAKYNHHFEDENHPEYISRVFYKHERKMLRGMINIKKALHETSPWHWQAGAVVFNMDIAPVDTEHLNKGNDKPLPDTQELYEKYIEWGLISEKEKNGGFNPYIKGGIGYDSRDKESFASEGIWTELLWAYAPGILSSNNYDYSKITLYHRQYINLSKKKLVFAYRLGWQHKLWGNTPFYLLPHWNTSVLTSATSQGLGGGKTLRGIRRNRVVGDGSVMANAELRYLFHEFNLLKQNFSLGANIFSDFGYITQKYKTDLSNVPDLERARHFNRQNDQPHYSAGAGLKAAMNENFILSIEYGKSLKQEDGESGFYITMNYLF